MVRFKVTVKITLLRLEIALSLEKCCDLHMDHSFMEKIAVVLYVDLFLYALSDISDTIVVPQTCSVSFSVLVGLAVTHQDSLLTAVVCYSRVCFLHQKSDP